MAVDDARNDVVLKTMAFTLVGDLLVLCHSSVREAIVRLQAALARSAGAQLKR